MPSKPASCRVRSKRSAAIGLWSAAGSAVRVRSFTALRQQIDDRSQKAVVLKMRGDPSTKLTVILEAPVKQSLSTTFRELAESSEVLYTGDFPREPAMINRIVFNGAL